MEYNNLAEVRDFFIIFLWTQHHTFQKTHLNSGGLLLEKIISGWYLHLYVLSSDHLLTRWSPTGSSVLLIVLLLHKIPISHNYGLYFLASCSSQTNFFGVEVDLVVCDGSRSPSRKPIKLLWNTSLVIASRIFVTNSLDHSGIKFAMFRDESSPSWKPISGEFSVSVFFFQQVYFLASKRISWLVGWLFSGLVSSFQSIFSSWKRSENIR